MEIDNISLDLSVNLFSLFAFRCFRARYEIAFLDKGEDKEGENEEGEYVFTFNIYPEQK